ncbi:MAG: hypothetical protein PF904_19055 [Kiritimatiellae bacterium]|jgi:hypothetical protein|nr:hypothetical protein [Kiritimatiellia bacterium]
MSQIYHLVEVVAMMSVLGERICTARARRRWSMEMLEPSFAGASV